jgi:putative alpha-1,2-mannosidase
MKSKITLFICLIVQLSFAQNTKNYHQYVNPFIGTGGHGHTYPGPSFPFGMIQPGPEIGRAHV